MDGSIDGDTVRDTSVIPTYLTHTCVRAYALTYCHLYRYAVIVWLGLGLGVGLVRAHLLPVEVTVGLRGDSR